MTMTVGPVEAARLAANAKWLSWLRPLRNMIFAGAFIVPFYGDKGLGFGQIMALQAFMMFCALCLEIPCGYLADRFGRVTVLRLGVLTLGLGYLSLALAAGFWSCLPAELLIAVGYACVSGADDSLLIDSLKAIGRYVEYRRIGQRIDMIAYVVSAVGTLVGIGIVMAAGYTSLVVADGIATCLALIAAGRLAEAPYTRRAEDDKDEHVTWRSVLHTARQLTDNPQVVWLVVLGVTSVLQAYLVYWQLLAKVDLAGWPVVGLALLMCTMDCFAIATLGYSRARSPAPFRRIVVLAICLVIVAYAGLALGHWWLLLVFGANIAFVLLARPISDQLNCRIPSESRATMNSAVEMLRRVLCIIGGLAVGLITTWAGLTISIIVVGAVCVLSMATAICQLQRHGIFREGD